MPDNVSYLDWSWDNGKTWHKYGKALGNGLVERTPFVSPEDARQYAHPHYSHGPTHFRVETVVDGVSSYDEFDVTVSD